MCTDSATRLSRKRALSNYTKFLDRDGLKGARIGVARNMAGTNPRIIKIFEYCIEVMKKLGAVIIDPADVPNFDKFGKTELEVLHYEFKADLNKYLKSLSDGSARVHSMEDVIKFNEENNDTSDAVFRSGTYDHCAGEAIAAAIKNIAMRWRRIMRLHVQEGIDAAMRKHKLDAIVVPSGGPAWLIDLVNGDSINWDMESTSPAAVAGYPHITVPAGYVFGLPVGISFFAKAWQEPTLIKFAYAFEQATQFRRQPRFLPTANLNPH